MLLSTPTGKLAQASVNYPRIGSKTPVGATAGSVNALRLYAQATSPIAQLTPARGSVPSSIRDGCQAHCDVATGHRPSGAVQGGEESLTASDDAVASGLYVHTAASMHRVRVQAMVVYGLSNTERAALGLSRRVRAGTADETRSLVPKLLRQFRACTGLEPGFLVPAETRCGAVRLGVPCFLNPLRELGDGESQ